MSKADVLARQYAQWRFIHGAQRRWATHFRTPRPNLKLEQVQKERHRALVLKSGHR